MPGARITFVISEKHHLLGIVANVDDTFLTVSLSPELRVSEWRLPALVRTLEKLEFLADHEVVARLRDKYQCVAPRDVVYTIEGEIDLPQIGPGRSAADEDARRSAEQRAVDKVAREVALLKLFKDSSIDLVAFYLFTGTYDEPEFVFAETATNFVEHRTSDRTFSISPDEAIALDEFRTSTSLPLKHAYLQLAYDNFMQSYRLDADQLKFLVLMIAMEVLFNTGRQELTYRVSRGVATLLSRDLAEGEQLLTSMKKLYSTRSTLVHTGVADGFGFSDVTQLRSLVRRALVKIARLDLPKDSLARLLTAKGFGGIAAAT